MYSKSIQSLLNAFSKLPGVGPRTAERFVFYLLKSGKKDAGELALALKLLIQNIKSCETCWDFSDQSPCVVCADKKRDHATICVVEDPQDLHRVEQLGEYPGVYHVLRGSISPGDEDAIMYLKINDLLKRADNKTVTEIILALNPDLPGETTMMHLEKKLRETNPDIKITRLARGLPMGSDLQYADEITLGNALKNRIMTK